ncbi:MAG: recombinase family protein [Janthinobacterium lividum]
MPDEQDKVNELYDRCLAGATFDQAANRLMAEGYEWTHDLHEKRAVKRNEHTKHIIYAQQIKTVLTDPRYIGKQKKFGVLWDCPAYLVDGERTVVPIEKWQAVQEIITRRSKAPNHINRTRSATGLLRCGLCAQCLRVSPSGPKDADGNRGQYWIGIKGNRKPGYWCTDTLPTIAESLLDEFLAKVLCPLLLTEVRDKMALQAGDAVASDRAAILRQLAEAEHYWEHVLPTFDTPDITAASFARKEQATLKKIADLRLRLREAEDRVQGLDQVALSLEQYTDLPPQQKRDILHAVVRWIAVVPRWALPDCPQNPERKRPPVTGSRLLVLTSFGTYLTLVLDRVKRTHTLRLARPDEIIGSVATLPDPDRYLLGIERQWLGGHYPYRPDEVSPGYTRTPCCPAVAEFEAEFDIADAEDGDKSIPA